MHVQSETQTVLPVQPIPPHWPYFGTVEDEDAELLVGLAVVEIDFAVLTVVVVDFIVEVLERDLVVVTALLVLDGVPVPVVTLKMACTSPRCQSIHTQHQAAGLQQLTMSWLPKLLLTPVPVPVCPLQSSVHAYIPAPKPGTSAKFTLSVAVPLTATNPITTPSLSGPAQYGYSCPPTGALCPVG